MHRNHWEREPLHVAPGGRQAHFLELRKSALMKTAVHCKELQTGLRGSSLQSIFHTSALFFVFTLRGNALLGMFILLFCLHLTFSPFPQSINLKRFPWLKSNLSKDKEDDKCEPTSSQFSTYIVLMISIVLIKQCINKATIRKERILAFK